MIFVLLDIFCKVLMIFGDKMFVYLISMYYIVLWYKIYVLIKKKEINVLFIFVIIEVFYFIRMNLEFIDFVLYLKGFF